jgi:hypothetical protein
MLLITYAPINICRRVLCLTLLSSSQTFTRRALVWRYVDAKPVSSGLLLLNLTNLRRIKSSVHLALPELA